MKKISYIFATIALLFSLTAHAGKKCTRDMLEQVSKINANWRPVIGNSLYTVQRKHQTIVVVRMYDASKYDDSDPEQTDVQAVFIRTKDACQLVAITFSPIDVTPYIDLLVE